MKKFRAIAKFTTYGEAIVEADSEAAAYEIADELDGGVFEEIDMIGGWDIEIEPIL